MGLAQAMVERRKRTSLQLMIQKNVIRPSLSRAQYPAAFFRGLFSPGASSSFSHCNQLVLASLPMSVDDQPHGTPTPPHLRGDFVA